MGIDGVYSLEGEFLAKHPKKPWCSFWASGSCVHSSVSDEPLLVAPDSRLIDFLNLHRDAPQRICYSTFICDGS